MPWLHLVYSQDLEGHALDSPMLFKERTVSGQMKTPGMSDEKNAWWFRHGEEVTEGGRRWASASRRWYLMRCLGSHRATPHHQPINLRRASLANAALHLTACPTRNEIPHLISHFFQHENIMMNTMLDTLSLRAENVGVAASNEPNICASESQITGYPKGRPDSQM